MGVIDEQILAEVTLAQNMIREFLIEECDISDEKLSVLEEIFLRTSVECSDIDVNGRGYHVTKEIKIRDSLLLNTERLISYLIHEYCHFFTNRDYDKNHFLLDKTIDEGICDTFSDLVINYYFKKHKNVMCNGRKLNYNLPYDSYSCYLFHNSWVRTLLYPLEKDKKDKVAILELILGDPIKFFELTMGSEYASSIPKNENGFPTNIEIYYSELYLQNKEAYHNINRDSIYFRRNFILPAFAIQEKIEHKETTPLYFLDNNYYNEFFIEDIYFDGKKIYEIDSQELIEFTDLYWKVRCPVKVFIKGLCPFIDMKCDEITEQEIETYSFQILKNLFYILKFSNGKINKIGKKLEQVILSSLGNELKKLRNNQSNIATQKIYNMLYPDILNLLKNSDSDPGKNIYEILCSIEEVFKSRITTIDDYIETSKNMLSASSGTSKKCYDFGEFVLLESDYSFSEANDIAIETFENLKKMGINTYQILAYKKNKGKHYLLETRVPGTPIQDYTPQRTINGEITDEEYVKNYLDRLKEISENPNILQKFVEDYFNLLEQGMFVDPSKPTNFYYNKEHGISFVDVGVQDCPYDNKLVINYIVYVIGWCESSAFTKEQIELEEYYLQRILDILNSVCIKMGKDPSIYMNDFNGNSLKHKVEERKEYRYEYLTHLNSNQR